MGKIQTEYVDVDGIRLNLQRSGQGDTLLLLHGANGNSSWLPVFKDLAQTLDVILPDHPGFGNTNAPDWMDNISDMAYFYLDLIDLLDIENVHLAGHSMGGWIAAEIAVRNSNKIKSLTLVSAAGIWVNGEPIGDLFSWSPKETVYNVFTQKEIRDQMLNYEPNEEEIETILKNRQMAARLCWSPRLHNPDLRKWLHRLKVPTLIVWGDKDGIFPEAYAYAYHDLIPGSELEIYENCGHVPMAEAREAFLDRIKTFTQRIG